MTDRNDAIRWFDDLTSQDTAIVGGKNASLGEMIQGLKERGIHVPGGFATTAAAYRRFIEESGMAQKLIAELDKMHNRKQSLAKTGSAIRKLFRQSKFPPDIAQAIGDAYRELSQRNHKSDIAVAARSSATAEDLPDASFAGQQESFLNVTGEEDLLEACRNCYASLFTDRAISYREARGFDHMKVALSVGVQKMVRSDKAGSGVMFTIDTDTGFPRVAIIDAVWGLGDNVVQGTVDPDEYTVFKPLLNQDGCNPIIEKHLGEKQKTMVYSHRGGETTRNTDTPKARRRQFVLSDDEVLTLAQWACIIEEHYGRPMDIEWAKDGETDELFIVQARPETVQSRKEAGSIHSYQLKEQGKTLMTGLAIGQGIASGKVQVIRHAQDIERFEDGSVLVTEMTDPDWVPVMKRAAAIVTDHGGRTSHAAIVSRELGINAVLGTGDGTEQLRDGQEVTVSCAEGDMGHVYEGCLEFEEKEVNLEHLPEPPVRVMINIASPKAAFRWWQLPVHGIGLARMEFIINNIIKIHPMALLHSGRVEDKQQRRQIDELTVGYEDRKEYFIEHLSRAIAMIAASQHPEPVAVRMSDFKTNEYANLIGGAGFEPKEENPMIGFRGASRYDSPRYREGFALECRAVVRAREQIGLRNIVVMLPFVRTPDEADRVLSVMAEHGLIRGRDGLKVYMMCEIPSNVFLADEFAQRFDAFSIGSNDLTQLILGVDRDSADLSELFDERDEAVQRAIRSVITTAHEYGCKVGICGQAPSDYPDFARFLVETGIDSISLNPDRVIEVIEHLAGATVA